MINIKHIAIACMCFVLAACNTEKNSKPMVVSTIGMIHNIVQEIGKEHVNAIGLMGPGVDPHLYKASAGDVSALSKANLIFYNGLHLEAKMIDIFESMQKTKPTVQVTKKIPTNVFLTPPEFAGFHDPHVWFDVSLWIYATKEVRDGLIELDPTHKTDYTKNAEAFIKELTTLHTWVQTQIQTIPKENRILVTAHDAFGYFGKAYDMRVVGLQGISTASEAGTHDIQNVTNIIIKNKVRTIFIESSVPVRQIKALQAAVKAKGWDVSIGEELFTDAMGDANTEEGTYIGMIKHNVNSIVHGLK
jgi:manganese/zinc/iron transport system substrate-binding protein